MTPPAPSHIRGTLRIHLHNTPTPLSPPSFPFLQLFRDLSSFRARVDHISGEDDFPGFGGFGGGGESHRHLFSRRLE